MKTDTDYQSHKNPGNQSMSCMNYMTFWYSYKGHELQINHLWKPDDSKKHSRFSTFQWSHSEFGENFIFFCYHTR